MVNTKIPLLLIINVVLTVPSKSFDDVNNYYSGKRCNKPWLLKSYESLHTLASFDDNAYCIQADVNSCVKISPINFLPANIEATVYFELFSNKSNIIITVLNEKDATIVECEVNRLSDEYLNGWHTLLLTNDHYFTGYVKVESNCAEGDTILVDSIQCITNDTTSFLPLIKYQYILKTDSKNMSVKPQTEFNLEIKSRHKGHIFSATKLAPNSKTTLEYESDTSEDNVHSTTNYEAERIKETENKQNHQMLHDNNNEENPKTVRQDELLEEEYSSKFWNPWTITLVSVGVFVIVSVTAVTAYHLGKNKGQSKSSFVIDEEQQPPRIIPRVPLVHSNILFNAV